MNQTVKKPKKTGKKTPVIRRTYSFTFKLKMVKLHQEGSVPLSAIYKESGVSPTVLGRWCKQYNQYGEEGLKPAVYRRGREQVHSAAKEKMVEIKEDAPESGVRKIANVMRRIFFLPGSHETVRQTLHKTGHLKRKPPEPKEKNAVKPRRFERSTPNQMWQSDITMFRLGGVQVYLIGFIDDYSRYIVGIGLYSQQKAAHVLEIYGRATVEYGVPKEMLTDNGRQYTSWRGSTQFEARMKKDRVKHIKSQPHHPMTLGKIERFWETIFQEFLSKATFDSFEDAQERIRLWVQYYNHRRPHQGIEGLCPADRYFEVATELKKIMEQGVKENVLEMALRGKPQGPFYMVGRMRGQSVVLTAEKGKLKLRVDGKEAEEGTEVIYKLPEKDNITGEEHGKDEDKPTGIEIGDARCDDAVQGSSVGVDGSAETLGNMPGTGTEVDDVQPLAEAGDGRNATGAGTEGEFGTGTGAAAEAAPDAGEGSAAPADALHGHGRPEAVEAASADTGNEIHREEGRSLSNEGLNNKEPHGTPGERSEGAAACAGHTGCAQREDDGDSGGELTRYIEAALLRVGAPCVVCNVGGASGPGSGPAGSESFGPGEGDADTACEGAGAGKPGPSPVGDSAGCAVPIGGMAA